MSTRRLHPPRTSHGKGNGQADSDKPNPLQSILTSVAYLTDLAGFMARIQVRRLRLGLSRALMHGLLIVAGVVATSVVIVDLCGYTIRGMAGGMAAGLGRQWLAELLTGLIGLFAVICGAGLLALACRRHSLNREVANVEEEKPRQHDGREPSNGNGHARSTDNSIGV